MKKAWKWGLVSVGVPLASIAILWVDSYYRAVAAIRDEDERLAQDIARFRSKGKPGVAVNPALIAAKDRDLPCPMSLYLSAERARVDQGHSGNRAFDRSLRSERLERERLYSSHPEPPLTMDQLITALTITQELAKECGYESILSCYDFQAIALGELRRSLKTHPSAEELARVAKTLEEYRDLQLPNPWKAQTLMDRAEVLRVLHLKADPLGFVQRPPGWREFFSWRIHLVKCLKELEEDALEALASTIDEMQARRSQIEADEDRRRTRSALLMEWVPLFFAAREAEARWDLARTAVASARYRADRGRDLNQLQDLVPKYLPRLPTDRLTGSPLELEDGVLKFRLLHGRVLFWNVRQE